MDIFVNYFESRTENSEKVIWPRMAFHPDHMESISIEKIYHLRVSLWLESTGVKSYQWLHFVSKFISDG